MNSEYKISILVPIYGVEKYIERCAVSLMEQTYPNIEYIFVNDCTRDHSIVILKEVISRYPSRVDQVQIINHEKNRGLAAARNTGVDACSGDYLMHVDSDDWLEINAVEKLVQMEVLQTTDILIFGYNNVYSDKITRSNIDFCDKTSYIKNILLHTTPASIWNKIYKTSFYKTSGIRSIEGVNHGEDYAVVPRLLHKADSISVQNEPLYNYNLTNTGSYTQNITLQSIKTIHKAFEINFEYFTAATDADVYSNVLQVLPLRSMLALIKKAKKENYIDILGLYPESLDIEISRLSFTDKLICFLLRHKLYSIAHGLINIYRKHIL